MRLSASLTNDAGKCIFLSSLLRQRLPALQFQERCVQKNETHPGHSSQMFWGASVAAIDRNRIVTVVPLPGVLLIEIDPP